LVDHFQLVALNHGDIDELAGGFGAAVLDHEESGSDDLDN